MSRLSSPVADDVVVAEAAPVPTARRGLSRRGLLGRAGLGVGAVGLLSGALPPVVEAQTGALPGLPSVDSVRARLQSVRLIDLEVVELAALLQAGETSSVALTEAYLARIDLLNGAFETYGDNGGYNAFVRIDRGDALAGARAADARLQAARGGGAAAPYLCGIPIGVKDSIGLKGRESKNGSVAFSGNVATEDASAMRRLRELGVVFIGHTICSEFSGAIIGTFAGNAWDRTHFPGGSSQGSGVAPMARLAAAAIGEETGGSITFPAAANGASAIKPSLGSVSVAGVMPLTAGTDVIGPICRSMRDAALFMNAMVGTDVDDDPQTLSAPTPFESFSIAPSPGTQPLAGIRIGVPQNDFLTGTGGAGASPQSLYSAENLEAFNRLRGQLEQLGATVVDFQNLDIRSASQNPYFTNADVLDVVDGTNITATTAVRSSNNHDIRYSAAIEEFAAERPTSQDRLLSNYGRTSTVNGTTTRSIANASAFEGGISTGARREGERRRRVFAANYQASLDAAQIDFMLVLQFASRITARGATSPRYRTYFQVPNALGWPMVSFPIGSSTTTPVMPISAQFWGPRFTEVQITQAAIDYQARFPEYHTAVPPEPARAIAPRSQRLGRAEADRTDQDPFATNDPEAHEAAMPRAYRAR